MGAGKKKLERALSAFSNSKISKPNLVPGALGGYIDGYQQIQVAYRPDFVYVRLRTTDSETIQAFNDKVGIHWDLPILVYRDPESPGVWRVYGRDIRAYDDWEGAAYNNPHAATHSFAGATKTGADVVWTFKRQYMPLLMHPEPTGTMGVYIEPDFYVYQGNVRWWPGSGSASLASLKPTGSFTGRFVTVYLNSAGNPAFLGGDEFSALDVPTDPSSYIEIPSTTQGVPLGAVLLLSGTEYIGWGEIYDLRLPNQAVFPMSDVSGSLMFYDEASLQGSAPRLNVTGERLTVRVSGSYATIHASPDPVDQIGVFNVMDPPGSAVGTGTVIEWGDNLSVTISGTTIHVDATAGGGVAHVFPGGALVIPDLYPLMFTWTGSAGDAHTTNVTWEDIANLSGTFTVDNPSDVFISLVATVSLTSTGWNHNFLRVVLDAVPLNPTIYYTEDAGHSGWEVLLTYDAVQKNIASGAHTIEAQWYTDSGLDVNFLNRRLSLIAATGGLTYRSGTAAIGVLDEGIYLGAGNIFNFRGQNVEVTISGSAVDVFVTGSSGGGGHETGTVVIYDENTFLGVFEEMRFLGAGVDAYNSGSYAAISIPGGGGVTVNSDGIMAWDEGIPLGTGSIINFRGPNVEASISGTVIDVYVSGSSGGGTTFAGVDQIGIYGLDEGTPLGTGTWMNFRGPNVVASISGTVIDVYVSGSSGGGGHSTGTMVLYDEDTFVGVFDEMRFKGGGVNVYNSGSYASISIPGGGGSCTNPVPDLLGSTKASTGTPDDDFDGAALDAKWTATKGSAGTVSLVAGAGAGVYQVGSRPGWLSMQLGTAVGSDVCLRQDYTLPSGSSIVIPISFAMDDAAAPANNEIWLGVGVNQNDTGIMSGTTTTTLMVFCDVNTDGWRPLLLNGTAILGWDVAGTLLPKDIVFFRIDRAGLVYHAFLSTDGFSWTYLGSNTLASEATNLWIFGLCRATMANRIVVGTPWIREGTALTQDPWILNGTSVNCASTFAGVDQIGVYGLDDGVPVGTGTWLDAGPGLTLSRSGTVLQLGVSFEGGAVFNESSADVDFRVESDANANCFIVDGGLDKVGIGAVPTLAKLDITSTGSVQGLAVFTDTSHYGFVLRNSVVGGAGSGGNIFFDAVMTPSATDKRLGVVHFRGLVTGTTYGVAARIQAWSGEAWDFDSAGGYLNFLTCPLGNNVGTLRESLRLSAAENVFNESSNDMDFRVESNNEANMLFVDGGADLIGIGTATPLATQGRLVHVYNASTTGTVASNSAILVDSLYRNVSLLLRAVDTGYSQIYFGDQSNINACGLIFGHATDSLEFRIGTSINLFYLTTSGLVINNDSYDFDFRVGSSGNANMLFVDGGNDSVGIGTATPNANAALHISSTTKAFMPPVMNTTQRDAIASPTAGMIIWNSTTTQLEDYNGSVWAAV